MPKIIDKYSGDRKERGYIKRMLLRDTRIWFRPRSRMTLRIKDNRFSVFTRNMGCRYCEDDIRIENQEHLPVVRAAEFFFCPIPQLFDF